jgi:hypothetical protein
MTLCSSQHHQKTRRKNIMTNEVFDYGLFRKLVIGFFNFKMKG